MSHFPPQAFTRDVLAAAYEWLRSQPASIRELAQDSNSLVALYMQSRRNPGSLARTSTLQTSAGATPPPSASTSAASVAAATAAAVAASVSASASKPNGNVGSAPHSGTVKDTSTPGAYEMLSEASESFKEDLKNLAEGLKQFENGASSGNGEIGEAANVSPATTTANPAAPVVGVSRANSASASHGLTNSDSNFAKNRAIQNQNESSANGTSRTPSLFSTPARPAAPRATFSVRGNGGGSESAASASVTSAPQPGVAPTSPPTTHVSSHSPNYPSPQGPVTSSMPPYPSSMSYPPQAYPPPNYPSHAQYPHPAHYAQPSHSYAPSAPPAPIDLSFLDAQSYLAVQNVQAKLNLNSPYEALRLLISLGHDRVREILPKG